MAIGLILLVFLLVGMLLLGLSVGGRYPRRLRIETPSCGRCQYPVCGMPTFTCPECGSDVRDVGILLPRSNLFTRRPVILAAFALIVVAGLGGLATVAVHRRALVAQRNAQLAAVRARTLQAQAIQAQKNTAVTSAETEPRP
jgi:hypothetical protein